MALISIFSFEFLFLHKKEAVQALRVIMFALDFDCH